MFESDTNTPQQQLTLLFLGQEIRTEESLKLIFMLNYRYQSVTHYTFDTGAFGINASHLLITHYIHEHLSQKKVGDGFAATLGRDAERTPSAVSYFFSPFLSVVHQFANQQAVALQPPPPPIAPAKQRLRTCRGGCEV